MAFKFLTVVLFPSLRRGSFSVQGVKLCIWPDVEMKLPPSVYLVIVGYYSPESTCRSADTMGAGLTFTRYRLLPFWACSSFWLYWKICCLHSSVLASDRNCSESRAKYTYDMDREQWCGYFSLVLGICSMSALINRSWKKYNLFQPLH